MAASQPTFPSKYDVSHLNKCGTYVVGPAQDDEMLSFYGIVKVMRPRTILEFGFFDGDSARNWFKAADPETKVYSIDNNRGCCQDAAQISEEYPDRFKFILKNQQDVIPSDYDDAEIDLIFIDASHCFDLNKETFNNVIKSLSSRGLILVHDTGRHVWTPTTAKPVNVHENTMPDWITNPGSTDERLSGLHQTGERQFIEWIKSLGDYEVITMETNRIFRHGFSIIQRKFALSNTPEPGWTP